VLSPFGQIESVYARKHQGTGLGLTLTKAMIESHGGSLELRSVLGEGSIVELIFPGHRLIKLSASAA